MKEISWQASPILGVRNVRQAAVLGFTLEADGVFQPKTSRGTASHSVSSSRTVRTSGPGTCPDSCD
jgi:hypothetical protein